MKLDLAVTIIAFNEEARIEAAIRSVQSFAKEIIVVDSGSTDHTAVIAQKLGARVEIEKFHGFGQQKNFAQQLVTSTWVFNLDADERVTPELEAELRNFLSSPEATTTTGVWIPRKTWYLNRWVMHGGWYPNHLLRLARCDSARWTEPHLHEELKANGATVKFHSPLEHFSFPTQKSHIEKNISYAEHAKNNLVKAGKKPQRYQLLIKPLWKFFDGYILRAGFLDGTAGFLIAIHSAYATFLRYTYLYEQFVKDSRSR